MPREDYQDKLEQLRQNVLYMSELVLDRQRRALEALDQKDEDLAWEIIEGDHQINELYLRLEHDCIDLLALQQPVASDLRFIAASFKVITDLERVGDLAVNLADYSMDAEQDVFPEVDIQAIGHETIEMVENAMTAYANEVADTCYAIADRDDDVDERCERASELVMRDLIERQDIEDEAEIERTMHDVHRMLLTIRDLERVGDHAVNIAARTLYMVENDDDLLY